MNTREATDFILDCNDPAKWLRLLDLYIEQRNKLPSAFVLPQEYLVLAPLIEVLAPRPERLVDYIKAIRDTLPKGSQAADVNTLYRTVMTRYVQQERRARMANALDKAAELFGPMDRDQRIRYESKLYTLWGRRREALLKQAKGSTGRGALTTEERSEILELFWKEVDEDIEAGNLPPVE